MKNNTWYDLPIREKIAIISAIIAFVIGWGLTIAGFCIEPTGEVADSVLWILGQTLIYAASVFGLTTYFTTETRKMRKDIKDYVKRSVRGEEIDEDEE